MLQRVISPSRYPPHPLPPQSGLWASGRFGHCSMLGADPRRSSVSGGVSSCARLSAPAAARGALSLWGPTAGCWTQNAPARQRRRADGQPRARPNFDLPGGVPSPRSESPAPQPRRPLREWGSAVTFWILLAKEGCPRKWTCRAVEEGCEGRRGKVGRAGRYPARFAFSSGGILGSASRSLVWVIFSARADITFADVLVRAAGGRRALGL